MTDVTVVVSTYQRAGLIEGLVRSLLAQRTSLAYEVVVVDNGSTDDTAARLDRLVARDDTGRLRTLRIDDNRGPARARNLGWQSARAPVVAFTDDDCVATPRWLETLTAPVRSGDAGIAQGATAPRPDQDDRRGPWARTQRIPALTGFYETCNIAYRRAVLEEVGGFDEGFPVAAGEDTDLGLRARAAGARVVFVPDAVVHHEVWPQTFRQALQDRARTGHLVRLVGLRPQIRDQLPLRVFWRRNHPLTLLAVGTVAAGTVVHPALGAGLLTGWIAARGRTARAVPVWRRPVVGAQRVIADVWEVGVTAASAARHRTLLL